MALPSNIKIAPIHITAAHQHNGGAPKSLKSRGRKNSIVKVEEIDETQEQVLDQSMYTNLNVEWVNRKGAYSTLPNPACICRREERS